ncbi:hypothetical protein SNE25_06715 [Mucilaginibacter sabulilitoris]|uniref:DUF4595 domain-containing protein n=1 Tax=Mucilaginibacter sabulilitoris TaxID=1173583 RepID=A0ABZ0TVP7_9SPHI|nr:hypothetical protein [Mucilaginibacter sabulilitoris]WPU95215.1 hypothetical protein SNE25_06715 [Mucilaginibacter sabulilitoris]
MIFDNNHTLRVTPYNDLKVDYTTDVNGAITSFTITNDQGITYTFAEIEPVIRSAKTTGTVSYFKRNYDQYVNGISYTGSWKLTKMRDPLWNRIDIQYTAGGKKINASPLMIIPGGGTTAVNQYTTRTDYTNRVPYFITYAASEGVVTTALLFTYNQSPNKIPIIQSISGMGKKTDFLYARGKAVNNSSYFRLFLSDIRIGIVLFSWT